MLNQSDKIVHTTDEHEHFVEVTELAGQKISGEQLERMCNRYYWARSYVEGRDIVEVGCGAGQGLGFLALHAKSVRGGDVSPSVLRRARETWGDTIALSVFDAAAMPYPDCSLDAVLLFEAIYYLPDVEAFLGECRRILRPGGKVLIATANKDLFDFTPSPHSNAYYGVVELHRLLHAAGFDTAFFGFVDISKVSPRQRILRPLKIVASRLGLVPKTMASKAFLKKLFFGKIIEMPKSILDIHVAYDPPVPLRSDVVDRRYKVIYCAATLRG